MMPAGTAQMATSSTRYGWAPRLRMRRSVTQQATRMPTMMHSAYARRVSGPSCHAAVVGLGMAASGFTDAHATAVSHLSAPLARRRVMPDGGAGVGGGPNLQ